MTRFLKMNQPSVECKKRFRKTVFVSYLDTDMTVREIDMTYEGITDKWKFIRHIGYDQDYTDIFKAFDDEKTESPFTIYFGIVGDEFN